MLKLKRKLLLFNSINFIGFKYLIWNKLTNKITKKLLYQYESSIFLKNKSMKYKEIHYNQFKLNFKKHQNIFKFLKWYKINWFYNSYFLNNFNFYFSETVKEQYFSSLLLNNDLNNFTFSIKHNNSSQWLNQYKKRLFFYNYSYKTFEQFFNKRLKSFLYLRSLKYRKRAIKIFFLMNKKKKIYIF